MGYYDMELPVAEALDVRVSEVRVGEREAYRRAGSAELVLSVPSIGYGPALWNLAWYPDGLEDSMDFELEPQAGQPVLPADADELLDELYDLARFVSMVLICGDAYFMHGIDRNEEGADALAAAWGTDTASWS